MKSRKPSLLSILAPYKGWVFLLVILAGSANALALVVPKLISKGIDSYALGTLDMTAIGIQFAIVSFLIFALTYIQGITQTYTAEKVAQEVRNKLAHRISDLSFVELEKEKSSKLLTYLTSDIDALKMFVSFGVVMVISSVVVIIGAVILLLSINWKLALAVLAILPILGVIFGVVFSRLGPLFKQSQEFIDRLNLVISESIVGSALVRVFNSGKQEYNKFEGANAAAKENGLAILKYFAFIIPVVGIIANLGSLIILVLGGYFVIGDTMTIGEFAAFQSYVFILIFPILMLGFVGSVISQAQASYNRISDLLNKPEEKETGTLQKELKGNLEVKDVSLVYGEKNVLKDLSFSIKAGTKTAIIGPTAAGKTQLLNILIGLVKPTSGTVLYDGTPLSEYTRETIHSQVAIVFQDSVMFNLTLRENIGFSKTVNDVELAKAIETAELGDFVGTLSKGLDTMASERGTSLSGGQKQRVMLARALALNPKILLLDDFTARVDALTEKKILKNIEKNYPGITIVSVTQKVVSVKHYEKIIVLMEGEVLAQGTHEELKDSSPEYAQILDSQKSTQAYE